MILHFTRLSRPCLIRIFMVVVAVISLACGGCGGAPVAPPSPAAKEQEKREKEKEEVQDQAWNPVVVVEPGGRIFITYYGGRGGSEYRFLFNRSLDGGSTWLPEPIQLDAPPHLNARIGFHRLETNGNGRVAVTWSIERKEETFWRVREVRHRQSSDSGANWTGEALKRSFLQQSNYPTLRTGQNGELYLLFTEGTAGKSIPRFIRTTGSEMAWAPGALTLPGTDGKPGTQQEIKAPRDVNWPFLTNDSRGTLFAGWQETTPQGNEILINRSHDGGGTWLKSSLRLNGPAPHGKYTARIPVLALDENGGIYVVWEDFRHNTTDLYFNRSLDGGITWLDQDLWLTAVRPRLASASSPLLAADRSGHLYLLWTDIREAPNSLYFIRSLDRGATWLVQAIRLDRHPPEAITYAPRLAHDNAGHVYSVWWEGTQEKGSVRFRRSEDYGATWEKEQNLDSGQGKDGPRFPWLTADGQGGVYVVWSSDRTGRYQLYLNRSTDHGKTWLPRDVQITGTPVRKTRGS